MIPQPKLRKYPIRELKSTLNWTADEFRTFKAIVHGSAEKHLDLLKPSDKQDPTRWERFMLEVVTAIPVLEEYQNRWPILPILSNLQKCNLQKRKRIQARECDPMPLSEVVKGSTSRNATTALPAVSETSNRRRLFVGKPPPRRARFAKGLGFRLVRSTKNDSSPFLDGGRLSTSVVSSRSGTPTRVSHAAGFGIHKELSGDTACPFCEPVFSVQAAAKAEIDFVFRERQHMIAILSTLGIDNDRQLRVLKQWTRKPGKLEDFIQSIPTALVGALYKTCLWKDPYFQPSFNSVGQRMHQIPPPSPDVEKVLTNSESSVSPLLRIKGLALNQDMVNKIDEIERLNSEGWTVLKHMIFKHVPSLEDFEDSWPIFLHFKWRQGRVRYQNLGISVSKANGSEQCTRNVASKAKFSSSSESMDNAVPPRSGCPLHSSMNRKETSTRLQALLKSFDMEELMPLFLAAHIKSNHEFNVLCELNDADRICVFEQLEITQIKPFQQWMLRIVLGNLDMLD
ncbi:hypothetical protein FPV67DRAFT_1463173 [Lyophyllum atratum]|nr:hypothetical protein FPV67DRAFT_1463173 [Lyophyllum atratum]